MWWYAVARLKSAKDLIGQQRKDLGKARKRASLQEQQVANLEEELQYQKARGATHTHTADAVVMVAMLVMLRQTA